jgi:ABC-type branched-subunit amino acid transport system ATPase component
MRACDIPRAGIARTYQTSQLFDSLSVVDNVTVALRGGKLGLRAMLISADDPELRAIADTLLAFVGYEGDANRPAGVLAHVDRRLVEIARALAVRPLVLALDEPAAGLDAADTARIGELLRRLAEFGIAVILVEHDMDLVMSVSSHVVVLDAGSKIAEGPPMQVAAQPAVLAAYLGAGEQAERRRRRPLPVVDGPVLAAQSVSAGYAASTILRDAEIVIARGELVAVLGANGAGKTTLMRALTGLIRPIGGEVRFLGTHLEQMSAADIAREGLILVPEGRQVFPELSVVDNLRLGAYVRSAQHGDAMISRLLQRFPVLRERREQRAGLLSGGEQQMLAIARGLMACPEVLMLDEPSLGLAPRLLETLYDLIAELREEGTTVLLVDQMAPLALSVADRAYVLRSGQIKDVGSASDLARDPELIEAYLGHRGAIS